MSAVSWKRWALWHSKKLIENKLLITTDSLFYPRFSDPLQCIVNIKLIILVLFSSIVCLIIIFCCTYMIFYDILLFIYYLSSYCAGVLVSSQKRMFSLDFHFCLWFTQLLLHLYVLIINHTLSYIKRAFKRYTITSIIIRPASSKLYPSNQKVLFRKSMRCFSRAVKKVEDRNAW